ncbi:hypothetical protein DFH09DRAFT_423944 [Mycena vulgaris]|nr:hypothetical protein DFH09DRAFT_423944 [Mycena vulgaris]
MSTSARNAKIRYFLIVQDSREDTEESSNLKQTNDIQESTSKQANFNVLLVDASVSSPGAHGKGARGLRTHPRELSTDYGMVFSRAMRPKRRSRVSSAWRRSCQPHVDEKERSGAPGMTARSLRGRVGAMAVWLRIFAGRLLHDQWNIWRVVGQLTSTLPTARPRVGPRLIAATPERGAHSAGIHYGRHFHPFRGYVPPLYSMPGGVR